MPANSPLRMQREEDAFFKPIVKRITEYAERHAKEKLTVAAIAAALGYNPDYLSKAFCNATGISLKKYIMESKLNLIKDYLQNTEFSIKQIAYELGFDDEMRLIKFFTYHEKLSPTAYRNKYFNVYMMGKR